MSWKNKNIWMIIFFVFIVVLALSPSLFGDRVIVTGDTDDLYYYLPVFEFYGEALKSGESFLWNPHIFSGFPTYLSQSAGFFDPLNIVLFKFLPTFDAYYLRLAIGIILALVFSYLVGLKFGISRLSSGLIGMGHVLAFHWRFIGNTMVSNILFLLPFLFYVYKSFLENKKRKWMWPILGGVGLGWAFIAGNAQFILYSLTLVGLYALAHFFWIDGRDKTLKKFAINVVSPLLIIVSLGFLIGLPQILPSLSFSDMTIRSEALDYASATLITLDPGDLLLLLFPDYSYFPYVTGGRKPLYVGAILFLLALASFYAIFRKKKESLEKRTREMYTIFGLFVFALIASVKYSPIFYLMSKLPVYGLFRFPMRWMFFGAWFLAILGAYGLDYLKTHRPTGVLKKIYAVYLYFFSLISLGVTFLNFAGAETLSKLSHFIDKFLSKVLYGNFGFLKDPTHYSTAIEKAVFAWKEFTSFSDVPFLLAYLSLTLASVLMFFYVWKNLSWQRFRIYAFSVMAFTFLGVFLALWQVSFDKDNLFYNNVYAQDVVMDSQYRTYTFLLNEGFDGLIEPKFKLNNEEVKLVKEFQFASGKPNMSIFSGAMYVDGYDVFLTNEMKEMLVLLGSDEGAQDENRGMLSEEREVSLKDNFGVLSMTSGKYLVSGKSIDDKRLEYVKTMYATKEEIPLYLYSNKEALPRYYFPKSVISLSNYGFSDLIENDYTNFTRETYIDCDGVCAEDKLHSSDFFEKTKERNGEFSFTVYTKAGRWFVLNESYLPGWHAFMDGEEVNIHKANALYMAVYVPDGEHEVLFEYRGVYNELKYLKLFGIVD